MYPPANRTTSPAPSPIVTFRRFSRATSAAITGIITSGWSCGSFTALIIKDDETGEIDHRRRLPGQPRPGRVGLHFALREAQARSIGFGEGNHQQSHGTHRRPRRTPRVEGTLQ